MSLSDESVKVLHATAGMEWRHFWPL